MNPISIILPVQDPVMIFTLLVGIIFLSPYFFKLIKVPEVASFIIMGMIVGPYGFNILSKDSSIDLLGTIGLLYIMFIAGLELDPEKLKISKKHSLIFGIATFIIPFILGYIISKSILNLNNEATLLVSIMFSTHTLVAYPVVRKLGINRDISVLTAVGGTIITDTVVLLILSIIVQDFETGKAGWQFFRLIFTFGMYVFVILYLYPKIARWFYKHIKRDRPVHYLFLLFLVSVSSYSAELIGIEPIIGAFVAGLALNKTIPKNSLLMHHIDFTGNILFIPVFLIGIGMLINTRILFSGMHIWYVAGILVFAAIAGKWIAAFITGKILHFSRTQRNLLFGLTSSHAAATIAIILIGFEKGMIDITIFNATILIIFASSLTASFATEKAGKKLLKSNEFKTESGRSDRILVSIANPSTMTNLIHLATRFQMVNPTEPVYILSILREDNSTRENIVQIKETLEQNVEEFNHLNENIKVITRVDLNVASGITRAAKEYLVSDIVIGWSQKATTSQRIFGTIFDHLLVNKQTIYTLNVSGLFSDYKIFNIYIPENLQYEPSFNTILSKLAKLAGNQTKIIFHIANNTIEVVIKTNLPKRIRHEILIDQQSSGFDQSGKNAIDILFLFRKLSVAYNPKHNTAVKQAIKNGSYTNFLLIVPGYE